MEPLMALMETVNAATLITWVLIAAAVCKGAYVLLLKANKVFNQWRTLKNNKEEKEQQVGLHAEQLEEINRKIDRLTSAMDAIASNQNDMSEKQKEDMRSLLGDRLNHIFRSSIERKCITLKDFKNFHKLLTRYQANNGNGYIFDQVVPIMRTLPIVIEEDDSEEDKQAFSI